VHNTSGFELSANGVDYFVVTITEHTSNSVTLAVPPELYLLFGDSSIAGVDDFVSSPLHHCGT